MNSCTSTGPQPPAGLVQSAWGLQCKHGLLIGDLMLIDSCCWCSHGYTLPYLPCLTESWKQRQEGELGFIFIPQLRLLTGKRAIAFFTFYALRRHNLSFPFLPFFVLSFFSWNVREEIPKWFLKQNFQLRLWTPGSKASLCLLYCKVPAS